MSHVDYTGVKDQTLHYLQATAQQFWLGNKVALQMFEVSEVVSETSNLFPQSLH